mmetsp:Transcript_150782/g.420295  ORF Transcript_150782/g.420295 Transcript_150782/m.420295 type:complete len:361 (-) Transcript_150782:98-1180(-)
MGAALSLCIVDDSWEPEEVFIQKILKRYLDSGEAKLSLAIATLPNEPSSGAGRNLFSPADRITEVWIETLQVVKGWAPLRWRFGTSGVSAGSTHGEDKPATQGQGLRFWRAKVITALSNGDERSQWCLLQVATSPADRTMENAMLDRKDALKVTGYARKFNQHLLQCEAGVEAVDTEGMPGISVCLPVVCKVLQSPVPQFFARGDAVLLLPYTANEVTKFVFDGHEDFLEIPHAFFHYITWSSGGSECVSDLQGSEEDDGSVILVNPCMPRPFAFGTGLLFDAMNAGAPQTGVALRPPNPSPQMFDKLHPRCGPLCRTFDPDRRAKPLRRHCGVPVSCGLSQPACGAQARGAGGPGHAFL